MKPNQMSKRERYAIIAGIIFVCLYILIEFVISPFLDKREQIERALNVKSDTLVRMRLMKSEYDALKEKSRLSAQYVAVRPQGFTLFSFLDKLAGQAGLKDNIAYMKPSKSRPKDSPYNISLVEMKLQGINLKQLIPYLHLVETSENMVFIRRISITKTAQEGFIDAILQVETFEA